MKLNFIDALCFLDDCAWENKATGLIRERTKCFDLYRERTERRKKKMSRAACLHRIKRSLSHADVSIFVYNATQRDFRASRVVSLRRPNNWVSFILYISLLTTSISYTYLYTILLRVLLLFLSTIILLFEKKKKWAGPADRFLSLREFLSL